MLLAVDIGNSRIKLGIFDGDVLHTKLAIPSNVIGSSREARSALDTVLDLKIDSAIACSVVPSIDDRVSGLVKEQFGLDAHLVKNDDDFGLDIRYEPLDAAGTDRIVNCFAAVEKYSVPCIVCSFGTATTIDVVNSHRVLLGGLIAPGMRTSVQALELAAERLPEVEIEKAESLIAHTTVTSIQSGVFFSQVGLIEAATRRIRTELGVKAPVIATGGFAPLIAPETGLIDIWDEDLTLDGLRLFHDRRSAQPA